jgi:hypothetical protein
VRANFVKGIHTIKAPGFLLLVGEDDAADDRLHREERSLKFAESLCQGASAFYPINRAIARCEFILRAFTCSISRANRLLLVFGFHPLR